MWAEYLSASASDRPILEIDGAAIATTRDTVGVVVPAHLVTRVFVAAIAARVLQEHKVVSALKPKMMSCGKMMLFRCAVEEEG